MLKIAKLFALGVFVVALNPLQSLATTIREELVPPSTPGNAYSGTFFITPTETIWAFGVGNDEIQDTSISGIAFIDGLEASDHWISALISRAGWEAGFNFDSIRPIGATPPSSFSMDTSTVAWQWGSSNYVAFYWLSEAGNGPTPLAVLQPGTEYEAFKFFTSGPASPFAAFTAADGGDIITGETIVEGPSDEIEVEIDIRPYTRFNIFNCRFNGVIPVAILSTSVAMGDAVDFDATTVDPSTVVFGPGVAPPFHIRPRERDVDWDGDRDLILHFRGRPTGIQCGDTEACVEGETIDGTVFTGCDSIRTVPRKR